ncbi:MAG: hypothetical protein KAH14_00525 [Clostridiales bacterium]|nr:hypothetical protein [Clostridiales bacterium]
MKKKKVPGVFFSDPSGRDVTREAKDTIKTYVECENDLVGTHNLGEDYKRIIDISYGQDCSKKKKKH